jgi:CubicO group peptidase (beta-lactamase class C family)
MSHRRKFLQQIGLSAAGFILVPGLPSFSRTSTVSLLPDNTSGPADSATGWQAAAASLPRSTPEQQGISSAAVRSFLDAIKASGQEFHSIMVIRHGHVIAEGWWAPFSADHKQQLYSLSKSFTSTAIGMAVDEKRLSIEDPVLSFFPRDAPQEVSANLAALKVRHLLSMSVGHAKDSIQIIEKPAPGDSWEKTFLALPIIYTPGERFLYNSGASYMLCSIINRVTGQSTHAYLGPRLYEPLGITGATWTENSEGVNIGASNLRIRTEDIGKLGQLYLQKGIWNNRQLLSQEWVAQATVKHIGSGKPDNSWGYGYGYQFWMNPPGGFRADGAYGQYSMVFPDKDTVVAITSESADKAATMATVWDHLYPELKENITLPANPSEHHLLQQELKTLALNPPQLNKSSPLASAISGKKFLLDKNEFNAKAVSFRFEKDKTIFTLMEDGKPDIVITCGTNEWIMKGNYKPEAHSLFSLRRIDFDSIVAASAGWKDNLTLLLTFRFIEAIHGDSLTCIFDGDNLRIKLLFSGAVMDKRPDERADLTGKA